LNPSDPIIPGRRQRAFHKCSADPLSLPPVSNRHTELGLLFGWASDDSGDAHHFLACVLVSKGHHGNVAIVVDLGKPHQHFRRKGPLEGGIIDSIFANLRMLVRLSI